MTSIIVSPGKKNFVLIWIGQLISVIGNELADPNQNKVLFAQRVSSPFMCGVPARSRRMPSSGYLPRCRVSFWPHSPAHSSIAGIAVGP